MEFVHPEILWGLSALAIPIIVHLLHFRRYKRVAFSHVAFLQQVERQTRSTQRLKHLLVLLARLLAVLGLVLAFAQPFTPPPAGYQGEGTNGAAISLFIDNSLSMEAEGERGPLLQTALDKAAAIIEQYGETDRFHVFTQAFRGSDQRLLTREQALERLHAIEIHASVHTLDAVLERAEDALASESDRRRSVFIFSDLQKNTHDLPDRAPGAPDTSKTRGWPLAFVPGEAANFPNVWVDSVWFETPMRLMDAAAALHVRIKHNSPSGADDMPIRLEIDGERAAIGTFNLIPGMATDTVLRFTHGAPGWKAGEVIIEDAPVQFDDRYCFGFEVAASVRAVGLTEGKSVAVGAALAKVYAGSGVEWEVVRAFEPEILEGRDLVVVFGYERPSSGMAAELRNFAERGGTVVLVPDSSEKEGDAFYKTILGRQAGAWSIGANRVRTLRWQHPLFSGVFGTIPEQLDLPKANRIRTTTLQPQEETLAQFESGVPMLTRMPLGAGSVFSFHADIRPEDSNFLRHALWVPIWLRLAERARATPVFARQIGGTETWSILTNTRQDRLSDEPIRLEDVSGNMAAMLPPFARINGALEVELPEELTASGCYRLTQNDSTLAVVGMNHDRKESNPLPYNASEWSELLKAADWENATVWEATESTVANLITRFERGQPHWQWMLGLALIALILEIILLRPWKKTS